MPEQFLTYWDDTLKKYVEVSSTTPLPTNAVGGGSGGAEEVEITSANGAATTAQGNADGVAASGIGLSTNSRNYGFNGTTWDRIKSTNGSMSTLSEITGTGGLVTTDNAINDAESTAQIGMVSNSRSYSFNGTTWERNRAVTGLADANNGVGLGGHGLYGYNGTTWDRMRSTGGAPIVPTVGTHANAWNAVAVLVDGVSASVDCQYVSNITVFGNSSVDGTITLEYSQDNTNFYGDDLNSVNTGGNNFAINATIGARYIRLKSDTASTITATISGKG